MHKTRHAVEHVRCLFIIISRVMATAEVSHLSKDTTDLLKKCSELKEALRLEKSRLADTHRNVH